MSKRKELSVSILLIIYLFVNCVTGFIDDSTSVVERSSREINNRPLCTAKKDYDLITEYKRLPENRYVAEYKRFPEYRYSFGIGKRWYDDSKRNTPYSFGIGKRYQMDKMDQMEKNKLHQFGLFNDYLSVGSDDNYPVIQDQQNKRGAVPKSRNYDFGVGKRNIHIFSSIKQPQHINPDDKHDSSDNYNNDIWEQD
ncbi:allatostatin A-like [Cotesia glomerata]|uniref:Uncharacterized protein n=1 Tax=Cotesia glomerata TaxID=32391 RepID=A0AAV7ISL5_COTGL|nr:allatostatin A-like [Cotesia glomerata]KAH0554752.1 hypothetical protein KQX54_012559 [Cotesia glomerata]